MKHLLLICVIAALVIGGALFILGKENLALLVLPFVWAIYEKFKNIEVVKENKELKKTFEEAVGLDITAYKKAQDVR